LVLTRSADRRQQQIGLPTIRGRSCGSGGDLPTDIRRALLESALVEFGAKRFDGASTQTIAEVSVSPAKLPLP
jgi:hypothetical protein